MSTARQRMPWRRQDPAGETRLADVFSTWRRLRALHGSVEPTGRHRASWSGSMPRPGVALGDVGCGTGASTSAVLRHASPPRSSASTRAQGRRGGRAAAWPTAVPGSRPARRVRSRPGRRELVGLRTRAELRPRPGRRGRGHGHAASPEARVAAYVWDYAGRDAAAAHVLGRRLPLDAAAIDPTRPSGSRCASRAPCRPVGAGGARRGTQRRLEITTEFRDFDDLWTPFLGGDGHGAGIRRHAGRRAPATGCATRSQRMVHADADGSRPGAACGACADGSA